MAARGGVAMTDLFLLSEAQMRRIEPFFPLSHGVPRVDDRRVISGIVFVIRNGLRWRDAPREYSPHNTNGPKCLSEEFLNHMNRL
jgi:transposase